MKAVEVTIKGVSPLLQHAFPLVPIEALEKKSPQEQAELATYRDPDTGMLYVPSTAIARGLIAAGAFLKGKGRGNLSKPLAACVVVSPERLSLGVEGFNLDARPVVVPATKGRVMRYRPRLDEWQLTFTVEWDETLLTEAQLRSALDCLGTRVGILDFRPERKGPFGRFMVTEWSEAA